MSEYQYFEFAAIDRPLTDGEMAALRAVSTRAVITPSGFVNHYEWGGLKADPLDWMRRYFDAFVYLADWAQCRFALRLPRDMFGKAELKPFGVKQSLTIDASEDHWILDSSLEGSDNYDRFAEDDGRGWMGRLVPLRDELIRGDQRSLYLGWLAAAAKGEVPETTLEPTVPAGLSQLSAAQNALAAFLEIDADIIAAAAIGSADASDRPESVDAWLQSLSPDELRSMLKSIVRADRPNPQREVASRYRAWHRQHAPQTAPEARRRSVAELRSLAVPAGEERRRRDALAREQQAAARRTQRDAQLRLLMSDVDKRWLALHQQAERGSASAYEQAVRALSDLAEAYAIVSDRKTFDRELRRFLVRHAKRGALLRRLTEAGLWQS
ncbi:MAG: hypothetical protein Q8N44_08585 [Rubrivivax sp.]|nr:hypothetical protein [Rubrivivax sp.]